ncbi:MAG: hypothetical protein QMB63_05695 [Clostridiaceae bacterium]
MSLVGMDLDFKNFVWSQDKTKKDTYYVLSTCSKGVAILLTSWDTTPRGISILSFSDLHYYSKAQNMFTEEFTLFSKEGLKFRTDINYLLIGFDKQRENMTGFIKTLEAQGIKRGYNFEKK